MTQSEARRAAKALGGIAVGARLSPRTGRWMIGGWPSQPGEVWIVVDTTKTVVLADRTTPPNTTATT